MDSGQEIRLGTERALFLLAERRSETAFDDLLSYASEVCLSSTPQYLKEGEVSKYDTLPQELSLVQSLGARSLAALIETADGIHTPRPEDHKGYHVSELIEHPDGFSTKMNMRILENAERFGQALIDESFAILGKDANLWVEKLRTATTEQEEMEVIYWLDLRLATICERSRSESSAEDEAAHFYPPYRISPKFIGTYPKPNVQPSCLSASIIATSFLERAGMPTLHAGVMTPAADIGSHLLEDITRLVVSRHKDTPPENNDAASLYLAPLVSYYKKWQQRPLAQHGAVYTRLPATGWVQVDAYSDATHRVFNEEATQLDALEGQLKEWKDSVPNLEFSTALNPDRGMRVFGADYASLSALLATYEYDNDPELLQKIDGILKEIPDESYGAYLYDTCLPLLLDLKYREKGDTLQEAVFTETIKEAEKYEVNRTGGADSRLLRIFDNALRDFVRWGETPEEFIQLCRDDPHYRTRRARDLLTLPSMMAIYNAQLTAQTDRGFMHLSVDIGNPAMRIGLASLSDFSIYDDNPLPASFWTTHWPGTASVLENIENPPASMADWALVFNNLLWREMHPFTSSSNYDKVSSFLLAERGDKDYGSQEEGSGQADR